MSGAADHIGNWLVLVFVLTVLNNASAQTVTQTREVRVAMQGVITLMDVEGPDVQLALTAPSEAGAPLGAVSSDNHWLNYTLSLEPNAPSKQLLVQTDGTTLPPGVELTLEAATATARDYGTPGTPTGEVALSANPAVLLQNMTGYATGTGTNLGHRLTYRLRVSDYAALDVDQNTTVVVLFTITD